MMVTSVMKFTASRFSFFIDHFEKKEKSHQLANEGMGVFYAR